MTPPLTDEQIRPLENRLRARLQQLQIDIATTLEASGHDAYQRIAGEVPDLEDSAFAKLAVDLEITEVARETDEVRDIDTALRRIAEGRYGHCLDCGELIPLARLHAYPSAKRCYGCQQALEHEHAPR